MSNSTESSPVGHAYIAIHKRIIGASIMVAFDSVIGISTDAIMFENGQSITIRKEGAKKLIIMLKDTKAKIEPGKILYLGWPEEDGNGGTPMTRCGQPRTYLEVAELVMRLPPTDLLLIEAVAVALVSKNDSIHATEDAAKEAAENQTPAPVNSGSIMPGSAATIMPQRQNRIDDE